MSLLDNTKSLFEDNFCLFVGIGDVSFCLFTDVVRVCRGSLEELAESKQGLGMGELDIE